jgi:hypothetical protein
VGGSAPRREQVIAAARTASCRSSSSVLGADAPAEHVVRDPGQQAGRDPEAGEAERDLEVAVHRRGDEVDEGLTGDGDDARGDARPHGRVGGQPTRRGCVGGGHR